MPLNNKYLLFLLLLLFGCATIEQEPNTVISKQGYILPFYSYKDYTVEIISDPPGAKIEWNNEYIGETPLERILNGDMGFTNSITVIANPIYPGQQVQSKFFTGDKPIPKRIYFNMNLVSPRDEININIQ